MRHPLSMLALAGLVAWAPALAADSPADEHGHAPTPRAAPEGVPPQTPMHKMHQLMDRVRATSDPAERRRLLSEHMAAMDDSMGMMRAMDVPVERRMEMMESMMQQMLGHQKLHESEPPAR